MDSIIEIQNRFNRELIGGVAYHFLNNPIISWESGFIKGLTAICALFALIDLAFKIKDQKQNLKTVDSANNFKAESSFHYLPDCDTNEIVIEIRNAKNCAINNIEFKGASFSASWNAFLSNVALRKDRGLYPRYFLKEQSFYGTIYLIYNKNNCPRRIFSFRTCSFEVSF